MSNVPHARPATPSLEEYFAVERNSPLRHEFVGDEIIAMAGGSLSHGTIVSNLPRVLGNALDGRPCRVFSGDQRVKSLAISRFFYPDSFALCAPVVVSKDDGVDSVTNPQLIVEVLSPSTQKRDRDEKFDAISTIPSVTEYALIEQTEARVTLLRRKPGGPWVFANVVGLDGVVKFESIDIEVPMRSLYRDVVFSTGTATAD